MKEQFVPYELELKLKDLGCNKFINYTTYDPYPTENKAILYEQAFDWFRDIGIHCWLTYDYPFDSEMTGNYKASFYNHMDSSHGVLMNYSDDKHRYVGIKSFSTYKECRLACLEKLIELLEQKKDSV